MQEARNAAFARRGKHDLGAPAVDRVKIVLVRHPHARQAGKVINLVDVVERFAHHCRIEYRAVDELHAGRGFGRMKIENAHAAAARLQYRDQMLPDEAAAAGNERVCH